MDPAVAVADVVAKARIEAPLHRITKWKARLFVSEVFEHGIFHLTVLLVLLELLVLLALLALLSALVSPSCTRSRHPDERCVQQSRMYSLSWLLSVCVCVYGSFLFYFYYHQVVDIHSTHYS